MDDFSIYKHCTGNSYQSWTHQFIISGTCGKNCFYQPKGSILYLPYYVRRKLLNATKFGRMSHFSLRNINSQTGAQQANKYIAIPASWDPPTAVCYRKKKKWNFKDKCNCMNLCSKTAPGLPPPPVRK